MSFPIHDLWTKLLLTRPETGMGYQVVELSEAGRIPLPALILNADRAAERLGLPMVVRERPALGEADRLARILRAAPRDVAFKVVQAHESKGERRTSGGADEADSEESRQDERFLRYSAFRNDRRIQSDGSVLPGTYATTRSDGRAYIRTGSDAVRRYALPNPDPAVHEFELQPPIPVTVRRGIAQPAHGQPGGGAEVIFDWGAPARTLIGHRELPP